MKNVASMAKFVIINNFDEAITIKSIEFSAPNHSVVGSFSIDFSDISDIRLTPIEASERALLEVANGESIASGEEATFHMAIAPFAAASGEQLTFKIRLLTSQGERVIEKSHTLTGKLTFTAGKMKDISLKCGEELEVVKLSLDALPPMSSEISKVRARIMCYNIRNCKGSDSVIDYKRVANVISRCNADVVALQEVDSVTGRHPLDLSKHLGDMTGHHATFGAAVNYSGGKYGVAVLSKEKPLSWRTVKLPCSNEERVFLIVEFENYYFCSTHFSLLEEYRLKAVEIIAEEVAKLNKPVFIAGDLNALPDSSVLTNLRQYFNIFTKSGSALTFPASAPNREIDYIGLYKNANYIPIIYEHYVVNAPVESDHRPILADVEVF
jgi:endonuclease/exonuclease/phosphatase family metal-dependent hydrolase